MNQISTRLNRSIYEIYEEEYIDLTIDEIFLDEYLEKLYPGFEIRGLVPPGAGWLSDPEDELIFWERILPPVNETRVAPILICPDDQDYSCSTVVALIERTQEKIRWSRFGFDRSKDQPYRKTLGIDVDWFTPSFEFEFDSIQYKNVIMRLQSEKRKG